MKRQIDPLSVALVLGIFLAALVGAPFGFSQDQSMPNMPMPPTPPQEQASTPTGLTLGELEQMALSTNPTLAQAPAEIRAPTGLKLQTGLYPNPTVGYQGEQIRGGSQGGGEQGFFVSQDIVLGAQLVLNRRVPKQHNKQTPARH